MRRPLNSNLRFRNSIPAYLRKHRFRRNCLEYYRDCRHCRSRLPAWADIRRRRSYCTDLGQQNRHLGVDCKPRSYTGRCCRVPSKYYSPQCRLYPSPYSRKAQGNCRCRARHRSVNWRRQRRKSGSGDRHRLLACQDRRRCRCKRRCSCRCWCHRSLNWRALRRSCKYRLCRCLYPGGTDQGVGHSSCQYKDQPRKAQ